MNKPFLLKPIYKDYIWGGQKIINKLNKKTDTNPCAESWEFSTHPQGISMCNSGEYKGKKLNEIFIQHPEYLGRYSNKSGNAPILIKFIDAKNDLSIQVHPSDEYALKNENSLGKTEAWYILESDNGKIAVGFKQGVDEEKVRKAIKENKICDYINYINVKEDELYPIESGVVHAICSGTLLVEIQECSDITYRLYDYDRIDKNGNKRPLHIDSAIDVLNYKKYNATNVNSKKYECNYFEIEKVLSPTRLSTNHDNFMVLICLKNNGTIKCENEKLDIRIGDSIFIPSDCEFEIIGDAQLLKVEV